MLLRWRLHGWTQVSLGFAAITYIGLLLLAGCDRGKPPKPTPTSRPTPVAVRLSVAEQSVFLPEELMGGDQYLYVSAPNGELWAVKWTGDLMVSCVAGNESHAPEPENLMLPSWIVATRVAVGNDDEGNPAVAIWVNTKEPVSYTHLTLPTN